MSTTTRTSTVEVLNSPPPGPPGRRVFTAAAVVVFAVVALAPWMLTTRPDAENSPIAPTLAGALRQQAVAASARTNAGSKASSLHSPTGYIQFCHNSPSLCIGIAPKQLAVGYVQFCENSPSLCSGTAPTARGEWGWPQQPR
jgi:hypothetical protein